MPSALRIGLAELSVARPAVHDFAGAGSINTPLLHLIDGIARQTARVTAATGPGALADRRKMVPEEPLESVAASADALHESRTGDLLALLNPWFAIAGATARR
jgi:hypothetical protein